MRLRRIATWSATLAVALAGVVALPGVWSGSSEAHAAAVPVGARQLFVGNFDSRNFCQWATVQNRVANTPGCAYDQGFYGMQVQSDGSAHPTAARFEVRDGDIPEFGGGERAEVRAPQVMDVREGDERWYEFSFKFGSTFPTPTSWFEVMQWHAGSGSPPLALEVATDGTLQLVNNRGEAPRRTIGAIKRGTWVRYVLHVKFSNDPAVGFAEVYQDGKLVVGRHSRKTMASDVGYLKTGIYRDAREQATAVLWQDGLRVTAP